MGMEVFNGARLFRFLRRGENGCVLGMKGRGLMREDLKISLSDSTTPVELGGVCGDDGGDGWLKI